MPTTTDKVKAQLPGTFEELVRVMPPRAISDDAQLEHNTEMIDRLMAIGTLTNGQEEYLETLVQLVQAYEASHHALAKVPGLAALKALLAEHQMNATALAALLGVHTSMGSKILKGDRSLTVEHIRTLAARFKVRPDTFMN